MCGHTFTYVVAVIDEVTVEGSVSELSINGFKLFAAHLVLLDFTFGCRSYFMFAFCGVRDPWVLWGLLTGRGTTNGLPMSRPPSSILLLE